MSSPDFEGHIPRLQCIAELCDTAVEFGVRWGDGTTLALVRGVKKSLHSYDIAQSNGLEEVRRIATERGVEFQFEQMDVRLMPPIAECDLLFIDTDHWYGQLKEELRIHAGSVKKFIGFHDTVTSWESDLGRPGIGKAIEEFLEEHPEWIVREKYDDWHGMIILENTNALAMSDVPEA